MIKQLYEELLSEYSNLNIDYHRKVDTQNKLPLFIGVNEDKVPYFSFEVPTALGNSSVYNVSSCIGFQAKKEKKTESIIRWKLVANRKESLSIFFVVIDDLVGIASNLAASQIHVILDRLLLWNQFFKKTEKGILDLRKQVGLFGELSFLKECMERTDRNIINNWIGPKAKTKDFVFNNTAVEIKTSIKSDTNRIHISDENQLDKSGFDSLFLNYRQIEIDQIDGTSIPDLIDYISEQIDNPLELTDFYKLLMAAGYSDGFRDLYINRYSLLDSSYFDIRDNFPSIIPSKIDFGVKNVEYEIEYSVIAEFLIEDQRVFKKIVSQE